MGARIAALRRQAGMNQAQLAQLLQVSPSAVGMYEQGRREPSAATLVAMAVEFGVSTDYLLTGNPSQGGQQLLEELLDAAQERLHRRGDPFSRKELAVLLAAILTKQA